MRWVQSANHVKWNGQEKESELELGLGDHYAGSS